MAHRGIKPKTQVNKSYGNSDWFVRIYCIPLTLCLADNPGKQSGPDQGPNCLTYDDISERIVSKISFRKKNQQTTKNSMQ